MKYFLPAHQGRAGENIISQSIVQSGTIVPMNYHFTTTKSHINLNGGKVEEVITEDVLNIRSSNPFKGNIDIDKLNNIIEKYGRDKISSVCMEACTNLIGGQPFSLENLKQVRSVCDNYGLILVLDASLLADNLYFIKTRE